MNKRSAPYRHYKGFGHWLSRKIERKNRFAFGMIFLIYLLSLGRQIREYKIISLKSAVVHAERL